MPFCESCGTEHSDDARFCPTCGKTVDTRAEPAHAPIEDYSSRTKSDEDHTVAIEPGDWAVAEDPPSSITPRPANPGNWTEESKSLKGLTTALKTLLMIATLISLVAAGLTISAVADVNDLGGREESFIVDIVKADGANSSTVGGIAMFGLIALPIFVLFVIWTHRAHKNLKAFGARNPSLPSGMAIGSWFIPLFWYVGPYLCVSDAYKGAAPGAADGEWRAGPRSAAITIWWFSFAVANAMYWVSSVMTSTTSSFQDNSIAELQQILDDPSRYSAAWTLLTVAFFLAAISSVAGVFAVQAVARRQAIQRRGDEPATPIS